MEDVLQTIQQTLRKQCTAVLGNFSCLHVLHGQVYIFSLLSVFSSTSFKTNWDRHHKYIYRCLSCRLLLDTKVCQEGTVGERDMEDQFMDVINLHVLRFFSK